ncbi:hypothetical protein Vadar_027605 [Vaccinium darrowii]|uniref:Uncharacterized protein n=1 Tax=Vaccinium darrowii TaxID=229202 RepID=A0ACB7Y2V8_9ERIC|nr:hypothetical protein Vadar_027605 [Vaccinium darrowii]
MISAFLGGLQNPNRMRNFVASAMIKIFLEVVLNCRGFNDAVNGFHDDGFSIMSSDGAEDAIVSVNSTLILCATSNHSSSLSLLGGIVCAKASMLLQVSSEYLTLYELCLLYLC